MKMMKKTMKNLLKNDIIAFVSVVIVLVCGGFLTAFAAGESDANSNSTKVEMTDKRQDRSAITTKVVTTKITTTSVTTTITTTSTTTTKVTIKKEQEVKLKDVKIYAGSNDKKSVGKESGKYFVYDGKVINGKVRMTSSKDYCGKKPIGEYVSFYISGKDLGLDIEGEKNNSSSRYNSIDEDDNNDSSTNTTEEEDYSYEFNEDTSVDEEDDSSSDDYSNYDASYAGNFTATFYDNIGCGYSDGSTAYGYSGNALIEGYSVASCYFAQGTKLKIEGSGLDGIYEVADKNCDAGIIDFYYAYRADIPDYFWTYGRLPITVSVVE